MTVSNLCQFLAVFVENTGQELKNPEQDDVVSQQSSCAFTAVQVPETELQVQDSFSGDAYWEASVLGVAQLQVELLELSF